MLARKRLRLFYARDGRGNPKVSKNRNIRKRAYGAVIPGWRGPIETSHKFLKLRVNLATRDSPRKSDPKSSLPPAKAKSITSCATDPTRTHFGRPGIMKTGEFSIAIFGENYSFADTLFN